jgi:hypothetical protein
MARGARRLPVRLGVLFASVCLALWLAPFLVLRFVMPPLAARAGGAIEVSGALPALPFGVSADRLHVAREGRELTVEALRAVLSPSGPRLDARVGDGTLLVRGEGLFGSDGFVRMQDVALESLAPVLASPTSVRGRADGVWRFGANASVEGTVTRGAVKLANPPFELPFAQLVVSAARDAATRDWNVRWVDLQGPTLSGSANGKIAAGGALALDVSVRQLEEPVKSFFALLKLPTEPPIALALSGTLAQPKLAATASPEGR